MAESEMGSIAGNLRDRLSAGLDQPDCFFFEFACVGFLNLCHSDPLPGLIKYISALGTLSNRGKFSLLLREVLGWFLNQGFELRLKVRGRSLSWPPKGLPTGATGRLRGSRLRRSLPGTIGKRSSAIAADDLHTRMGQQPLFEGLRLSIRQQVDGKPLFEINEDHSIASPSAKAKIVHTQHARRRHLALLLLANQPQERIGTGF